MTGTTIVANNSAVTHGVVRWLVRESFGVIMAAALLFLSAGRWDWVWGWATVLTLGLWVAATALAVIPTHPQLLAERTRARKGSKIWDTALMSIVGVLILALYVVGGLDERYAWTNGSLWAAQLAGMVLALVGYGVFVWATVSNPFFSQIVRIQKERGHMVATGGPYRIVRHPGYVGSIMAYVGTGIMLGSWLAVALGLLTAVLMIARTALEDRTLMHELDGYDQYASRVHYRLLPGIW